MVHRGEAGLFTQGTVLETLTFEHPELPQAAITAKVTFALGAQAGQPNMEFLGLGIHFAVMSEQTASDLRAYVARHQT